MFVAGATRPDIQYAVNYLAQYVMVPHCDIIFQTKRVLNYLVSTKHMKIIFNDSFDTPMIGYTDADHSGDKSEFISVEGSILMYANDPISWKSKKEKVSQSSTDAELISFIQTANIVKKVRRLLQFIYGFPQDVELDEPTWIMCDNNSMLNNCQHWICN